MLVFHEMSMLLNCQLDKNQIALIISLIEDGANPESLALGIHEIMKIKGNEHAGLNPENDRGA